MIMKIDEIMYNKRFTGQFYTPLPFAKLALEYIEKELGPNYYKEYKIWDMACGTGNLEYYIPSYENVYMSTLENDEINYIKNNNLFPNATIFQYDYLNDDVELVFSGADLLDDSLGWKLPRKLREDLANKDNKWLIFINPPFGSEGGRVKKNTEKGKNISISKIKNKMIKEKLKNPSRELSGQFFFRLYKEIPNFILGTFSTLKYLSDESFIPFYNYFKVNFKTGFIFPSKVFEGTSGNWPVSFIIWEQGNETLLNKTLSIDVYNEKKEKIGYKNIFITPLNKRLNKWIERPRNDIKIPFCLSSAINIKYKEINFITNALGYLFVVGNDISQQRGTALFSIPQAASAGGSSLTPNNFTLNCVLNQVRLNVLSSWINNKDQFMQPIKELSEEFINDSIIYSLFHKNNQTSSIKDIKCQGKIYQIRNQFFPFTVEEVRQFEIENPELYAQLRTAKDTYVASLLKTLTLSPEAQKVLNEGRKLYALYFKEYNNLDRKKYKLDYWDVGWYQIRMSLKEKFGKEIFKDFNEAYGVLTDKLRPQVYEYGFLNKEIIYDNEN